MREPVLSPPQERLGEDMEPQSLWKDRVACLSLGLLTLLYAVIVSFTNRKLIWYDEYFTYDIAQAPSLHQLWLMDLGFDNHTPTGYVLSRLSMGLFGRSAFALRLPEILAFYAASVATFLYVRRKAGDAFAPMAVLLVWASQAFYFATEARPYALLYMCFAVLLCLWDVAVSSSQRRAALWGIAAATLVLLSAHVFAPFTLLPFLCAEAVRAWKRRRPDYPLWAALGLPMLVMLGYIPIIERYASVIFPPIRQASVRSAAYFYYHLFDQGALSLAIVAATLALLVSVRGNSAASNSPARRPRIRLEEGALFTVLLLLPVLVNLVLMLRHGAYYERYNITSQAGAYILLTLLFARVWQWRAIAAWAAIAVLAVATVKTQLWPLVLHPPARSAAALLPIRPDLPLVAAEGMVFFEMNHRESPALLSRLYFLKDREASLRYAHSSFFEDFEAPDDMKPYFPIRGQVESYAAFTRDHRQFLLFSNSVEWVFQKLRDDGATFCLLPMAEQTSYPEDNRVYLVTLPIAAATR